MKPNRRTHLIIAAFVLMLAALVLLTRHKNSDASPISDNTIKPPLADAASPAAPPQRPARAVPREADRLLAAEGAKTDVTLASFPIKEYQHLPAPNGKAQTSATGEAYIHVPSAGRRIAMQANQIGEFPAVETKLNDIVGIRLAMDAVKSGTPVRVVIMDGGSFPAAQGATQVLTSAKWGGVAFEYTVSGNIGFHRVLVQAQGQPSRILNFNAADGETWPPRDTASTH
jgi:hypothetical protein